ncbi:MAG: hypothetical protein ACRDBY_01095, partial [Cetobacterium sp.]
MKVNRYNNKNKFIINLLNNRLKEMNDLQLDDKQKLYELNKCLELIKNKIEIAYEAYNSDNVVSRDSITSSYQEFYRRLDEIDINISNVTDSINTLKNLIKVTINPLLADLDLAMKKTTINAINNLNIDDDFKNPLINLSDKVTVSSNKIELSAPSGKYEKLNPLAEVISSNGFPGDTKRAYLDGSSIRFNGEKSLKIDIRNIYTDKEVFEYELITVPKETYKLTKGCGFKYDENVSYISNDDYLELRIKLKFKKPTNINTIRFSDTNATPYVIKAIRLTGQNGGIKTVSANKTSNTFNTFTFQSTITSEIELILHQYEKEKCNIGHYYKSEIKKNNIGYSEVFSDTNIGSITSLGVTVDNGDIIHPKDNKAFSGVNKNKIKKDLFDKKLSLELIPAYRASISIYDFSSYLKNFYNKGFVTLKYTAKDFIKKITLDANEFLSKIDDKNYIRYYISFDDENWTPICPVYRVGREDIHTIQLNSVATMSPMNTKSIYTNQKIKDFYIKIELATGDNTISPIINSLSYKIEG